VPTQSLLDDSFICALYKSIMHQGRLYVFNSFICFYSSVFGVERKKIIALQSVTAIVKARTALVVPNAIEVVTMGDRRDFFTSFILHDKAYRLMCAAWCNSSPLAVEFFRRQKEDKEDKERAAAAAVATAQAAQAVQAQAALAVALASTAAPLSDGVLSSGDETTGDEAPRRGAAVAEAPRRTILGIRMRGGSSETLSAASEAALAPPPPPVAAESAADGVAPQDAVAPQAVSHSPPKRAFSPTKRASSPSKSHSASVAEAALPAGPRHVRIMSDVSDGFGDIAEKLGSSQQAAAGDGSSLMHQGASVANLLELVPGLQAPHTLAYASRAPSTPRNSAAAVPDWSKGMRTVTDVELDTSLEALVEAVWSDDAMLPGQLAAGVHASRAETELHATPWSMCKTGGFQRDVTFRAPIKGPSRSFGKASTYCHQAQACRRHGRDAFVLRTSQVMNDIPYGDYFRIEFRWDVRARGAACCSLKVGVEVVFSKSTFLKGTIEAATFSETAEAVKDWIAAIQRTVQAGKAARAQARALEAAAQQSDSEEEDEAMHAMESLQAHSAAKSPSLRTPRGSSGEGALAPGSTLRGRLERSSSVAPGGSAGATPSVGFAGEDAAHPASAAALLRAMQPDTLHALVALMLLVAYLLGGGGGGRGPPGGGYLHTPPHAHYLAPPAHYGYARGGVGEQEWLAGVGAGGADAWEARSRALREEAELFERRTAFLRAELALAERKAWEAHDAAKAKA